MKMNKKPIYKGRNKMRKKVISILFIAIILISTLLSYKTYAIEWQEDYNVKLKSHSKDE